MNRTVKIAPVLKTVIVNASPEKAFDVFTSGINRWWPKTHGIGAAPIKESIIEPFVGGRWYAKLEDGSEVVSGHVRAWEAGARFVASWEISADWKPDPRPAFASEVEVRFVAEAGGGTRVELEHRDFERMGDAAGETMRKGVDGGWPSLLDLFAEEATRRASGKKEIVIHSIPGSPFGRAVLIVLEEKGAAYRLVGAAPGTLRSPEHLARHPFGRIPVMDHGDFRLYESQAILRYLDRVLPDPPLTPRDAQAAARMDQLMNINDWYLFQGVANVIAFQRVVGPRLLGLTPDEAAIAAAMPKARTVIDELAKQLGTKAYFVGDCLSLADVLLAPQLDFFQHTPEWQQLAAPHANLREWLKSMQARPSMAATTWDLVAAMAAAA